MDTQSKKKLLYASIALIIGLSVIGLIFALTTKGGDTYGPGVKIDGFSKKIKHLPSDRQISIQAMLLVTVRMNNSEDITDAMIGDAVIRDGSETQEYIEDQDYYKGRFIADLEQIRQSYGVEYHYKKEADSFVTGGNTVIISCLPVEDLIYGEFNCTDIIKNQSKGVDPLVTSLPFYSTFFRINGHYVSDKLQLKVELRIPSNELGSTESSRAAAVQKYKEKARNWVSTTGNDPNNYVFEYNYSDSGVKLY